MIKQKFILLDIDNTLFDSYTYRKKFSEELCNLLTKQGVLNAAAVCDDVYTTLRVAKGLFAPEEFVERLVEKAKLPDSFTQPLLDMIYDEEGLKNNLYGEIFDTLLTLEKYATLGIFSQGKEKLQRKKIDAIHHFFHEDHMHIVENKEKAIEKVFQQYRDFDTLLVDDALPILYLLHQHFPSVQTIWMKRGMYAKKQENIVGFQPNASIEQLDEMIELVKEKN